MYRLSWQSKLNGHISNGEYCLSFKDASILVERYNKKYKMIYHWLESKPLESFLPSASLASQEEPCLLLQ